MTRILSFLAVLLVCISPAMAREPVNTDTPGTVKEVERTAPTLMFPRIDDAGGVFALAAEMPDRIVVHKLVIDAAMGETTTTGANRRLDAAARAVNLYALAGIAPEHVQVAVVVHGKATAAILSDDTFEKKFGTTNPNSALLAKLHRAGVEIYICGQSLVHQGYTPADVHPDVRVSLSAMTKLVDLQTAGYALIP